MISSQPIKWHVLDNWLSNQKKTALALQGQDASQADQSPHRYLLSLFELTSEVPLLADCASFHLMSQTAAQIFEASTRNFQTYQSDLSLCTSDVKHIFLRLILLHPYELLFRILLLMHQGINFYYLLHCQYASLVFVSSLILFVLIRMQHAYLIGFYKKLYQWIFDFHCLFL